MLKISDFTGLIKYVVFCIFLVFFKPFFGDYFLFNFYIITIKNFNQNVSVGNSSICKIFSLFFFDEAHLLFNEMPNYRLKKVAQIVKLIRSRGIGLYFVSQNF